MSISIFLLLIISPLLRILSSRSLIPTSPRYDVLVDPESDPLTPTRLWIGVNGPSRRGVKTPGVALARLGTADPLPA